jgi:hypothetical protein
MPRGEALSFLWLPEELCGLVVAGNELVALSSVACCMLWLLPECQPVDTNILTHVNPVSSETLITV